MLITFEGPEGAGKSTVIGALADELRQFGRDVTVTREPGAGEVGRKIREILLHGEGVSARCELFLFLADRAEHVERTVRPALAAGKIVLCDRFADSTVVYQGYARGLDLDLLRAWNSFATVGLKPDLTLLLDLEVSVGLHRIQNKDRLDSEPVEFHDRVRRGFLSEAALEPDRWVVIDASQPVEEVVRACRTVLARRLSP